MGQIAASRALRPDILQRGIRSLAEGYEYPFLQSAWTRVCLWAAILVFCAARAFAGLTASRLYSHDAFFILDGAWRTMNGQRAQVDFTSVLGFLGFFPCALGLWISRGTVWGFGYGQALMGFFLSAWMYALGRNRLRDVPLAVMCLAVCLTVISPFCPGTAAFQTSPAETYNRLSYGFLALVMVEAIFFSRKKQSRGEFSGGVSTGAILAGLLFFKITYFFSAAFLVVLLIPCKERIKGRFVGMSVGFAAVILPCLAYYSFDVQPILAYYRVLGKVRHVEWARYALDAVLAEAAILITFSVIAAGWVGRHASEKAAHKVLIAGVVTTVCGVLTIYGNGEYTGSTLAPFVAIVIADLLLSHVPSVFSRDNYSKQCLLLFSSAIASAVFFSAVISLSFVVCERIVGRPQLPHMQAPRLAGFATGGDEWYYAGFVNEGMDLLNHFRRPGETVMSLDFTNPFAYGLGIRPAAGGASDLHYGHGFNEKYHQSPASLFGAADLVMLPKNFSDRGDQEGVPLVYGPYLRSHFYSIGECKDWILYRRNDLR